jgi:hypothetical protein
MLHGCTSQCVLAITTVQQRRVQLLRSWPSALGSLTHLACRRGVTSRGEGIRKVTSPSSSDTPIAPQEGVTGPEGAREELLGQGSRDTGDTLRSTGKKHLSMPSNLWQGVLPRLVASTCLKPC